MNIFTTTKARMHIKSVIDRVRFTGETIGIGRRDSIDALIIPFPQNYNKDASDMTNIAAYSKSFDFLNDEPELYSPADIRTYD